MADLIHSLNRLINSRKRVNDFIDSNIVDWVEQAVLGPTRRLAAEVGLSQNAQNTITIEKVGFMNAQMTWFYLSSEGAPLHRFLEDGTDEHTIKAKGKDNNGANFLMWRDSSGELVFRKKVEHPGTDGYKILARGWENNKDQLRQRVIEETNNFLEVSKI